MPHAWLLAGPEGTGKATFAYLGARAILSEKPALGHDDAHPIHRRIAEDNETALTLLTRGINEKTGKPRSAIPVEDIRSLKRAMTLAPTEGGWRVVIVDAAEDMNPSAANALLKLLEEPPARVVFFLVSHSPRRLLPTILSRCRRLDFAPLDEAALANAFEQATGEPPRAAVVDGARGSVGAAIKLAAEDGAGLRDAVAKVLAPLPGDADRAALHALADTAAVSGADEAFRTTARLIGDMAARLATASAGADPLPAEWQSLSGAATPRHAANWAEAATRIGARTERTLALNLDRRQALLDMVAQLEQVAKGAARNAR
jgi:DNA polymerase-3 subunit delta'